MMGNNHPSCPPSYKLSNDPNKATSLHFIIHILKDMLVELCVRSYATPNGLVNGTNDIFKTSTTYNDKTIM
jgi:hypothetical protein